MEHIYMTVSSIKDMFEGINSASSTQKKIHALISVFASAVQK